MQHDSTSSVSRRDFVRSGAALTAAALAAGPLGQSVFASAGSSRLRVGLIGCGGRGTGAAVNALEASPDTEITALADVFQERIDGCLRNLAGIDSALSARVSIPKERTFVGFDGWKHLLALDDIDIVILATPPHFRPAHLDEAVRRGKHVFMEKPVAVDAPGVRTVLAAAAMAKERKLGIVAGTQRRHEPCYLEAMKRLHDGHLGRIVSARCYWNQGGLWMHKRRPEWSDMEWQLRNWLYFTWLSGDHIVEQHVHNLDAVNWAIGSHPTWCMGVGGRQVRTSPDYGHIFDHFTVEYAYPDGQTMVSMCRQIDGCHNRVEEAFDCEGGRAMTTSGYAEFFGSRAWKFEGHNGNPYIHEHVDLIRSIQNGEPLNEGKQIAESTLTAIMGRMSAYTGKALSWEQALNSTQDLTPPHYEFGDLPVAEVAVPGRTPFV